MEQNIRFIEPVNIKVTDARFKHNNFKSLSFQRQGTETTVDLSDTNYCELIKAILPDDLDGALTFMNTLIDYYINKGWHLHDDNDADWYLSMVHYDKETDRLYFDCAEKKKSWDE